MLVAVRGPRHVVIDTPATLKAAVVEAAACISTALVLEPSLRQQRCPVTGPGSLAGILHALVELHMEMSETPGPPSVERSQLLGAIRHLDRASATFDLSSLPVPTGSVFALEQVPQLLEASVLGWE